MALERRKDETGWQTVEVADSESFPPEWTIGVNGELTIETGVAAGSPLEIVLPDDQTAPGIVIRNAQGTYLFRAGGSTHGIEMTADPAGLVSRLSLDADSFTVEDENGEVMIDIQGGYINLGDGGKIAAGPTDVYVGGATDTVGFYGGAGVAKQTGVAVTAAAVHAALVNLGLIAA